MKAFLIYCWLGVSNILTGTANFNISQTTLDVWFTCPNQTDYYSWQITDSRNDSLFLSDGSVALITSSDITISDYCFTLIINKK